MSWIVDASVALKWFSWESQSDDAFRLLRSGEELHAPDLIIAEITNIAWKKFLRGQITSRQADMIAGAILKAPLRLWSVSDISQRALSIARDLRHPVYDCLYLACAETVGSGVITADRRFHNAAQNSAFSERIILLGNALPPPP